MINKETNLIDYFNGGKRLWIIIICYISYKQRNLTLLQKEINAVGVMWAIKRREDISRKSERKIKKSFPKEDSTQKYPVQNATNRNQKTVG